MAKGEVQNAANWTIIGRIDQFAIGMAIYQFRAFFARRHILVISILTLFALFYWQFDVHGGFYKSPTYPSPSVLWVFIPTIEGVAYAIGIAWYEGSFSHSQGGFSNLVAKLGEYSYSIYLLHIVIVFQAATFVNNHVMNISNFYVACIWSLVFFLSMLPIGYLSFRFIEAPFLRLRKGYIVTSSKPE